MGDRCFIFIPSGDNEKDIKELSKLINNLRESSITSDQMEDFREEMFDKFISIEKYNADKETIEETIDGKEHKSYLPAEIVKIIIVFFLGVTLTSGVFFYNLYHKNVKEKTTLVRKETSS